MKNGQQSAFPLTYKQGVPTEVETGLTKREYFAAIAMQGMLSNPNLGILHEGQRYIDQILLAKSSIVFADELLKQLGDE